MFFRFEWPLLLCSNDKEQTSTGKWTLMYARHHNRCDRDRLTFAWTCLILQRCRAIKISSHCIVANAAGMSDLGSRGLLELL